MSKEKEEGADGGQKPIIGSRMIEGPKQRDKQTVTLFGVGSIKTRYRQVDGRSTLFDALEHG